MSNCGNFIDLAAAKCGVDVGFGKVILLYADKTAKTAADLTADAINAEIAAGTIIGVIKNWHTVAGAPVAEISVERTGTAEMKLIRPEILADVLTFESNLASNEVLADLVKAGSLNCILLDDRGNCFGDYDSAAGKISTMLINFSTKTTSSLQHDNATEKTVAITARYLVKDLSVLEAGVETELVGTKSLLVGQLKTVTTLTETSMVFEMLIKDKSTGLPFADAIVAGDLSITGAKITNTAAVYVPTSGILTVTLTGTGFIVAQQTLNVLISGADFYTKSTKVTVKLGE